MGVFFSSNVQPWIEGNSSASVPTQSSISVCKKYKRAKLAFQEPRETLDTVYEQEIEMKPHYEKETEEQIYNNTVLGQIEHISKQEFYDVNTTDNKTDSEKRMIHNSRRKK